MMSFGSSRPIGFTTYIERTNKKEQFIDKLGLEKTELVWNFFSMVEFDKTTIGGIESLDFASDFAKAMLEAFVEFDCLKPGLITQQFTVLAQKFQEKDAKLLIGEKSESDIMGCDTTSLIKDKYLFINFSEGLVKRMLKKPVYIIQQIGDNIPEIKAVPLGNLVARQEEGYINLDNPELIAKCAAYLLFHEFFHANTFISFESNSIDMSTFESFIQTHPMTEELQNALKSFEVCNSFLGDDFRNTLNFTRENEIRIPGEFELLAALYPEKFIMRLYNGADLNFSDPQTIKSCIIIANPIKIDFEKSLVKDIIEKSLQNINITFYISYLTCRIINILLQDSSKKFFKNIQQLIKQIEDNIFCDIESIIKDNLKKEKDFYEKDIIELRVSLENFSKLRQQFHKFKILNEDIMKLEKSQIKKEISHSELEKFVISYQELKDAMIFISEEKLLKFFDEGLNFSQDFESFLRKIENLKKDKDSISHETQEIFLKEMNKIKDQMDIYSDLLTKNFVEDIPNNVQLIHIDNSILENSPVLKKFEVKIGSFSSTNVIFA